MTVDELIEGLRQYPGDTEVTIDAAFYVNNSIDNFDGEIRQLLSIDEIGSESYYETVSHRSRRVILIAK